MSGDSVCDALAVTKGRLEAFTDALIAIVMTIMVLDLRPPAGESFGDLKPLVPKLLVYALSFTFLAIYWNNHHHLMHVVERIDGRVLWANMGLLFALSLTPAATAWLGEHPGDTAPVVVYGMVLLLSAIAYFLLTQALLTLHPAGSRLAVAIGSDRKGRVSAIAYVVGIVVAIFEPWVAIAIYVGVAIAWLVPDRRIVKIIEGGEAANSQRTHKGSQREEKLPEAGQGSRRPAKSRTGGPAAAGPCWQKQTRIRLLPHTALIRVIDLYG